MGANPLSWVKRGHSDALNDAEDEDGEERRGQ